MKARKTDRRGRSGRGSSQGTISDSTMNGAAAFNGLFYESEEDVLRRLVDRVHRGQPLRVIRP